ncbi:hypothetical protein OROHE_014805 [Orobanche hederae]
MALAGKTLSPRKWSAAFSPEGYLDIGKTLSRIHRGGVHPSIRGEVWEFLLGCYDPKSTFEEREQIRQHQRVKYALLKEECYQMFPLVGSGKFVTAPIITQDGKPIQDLIVLQQINLEKGPASLTKGRDNWWNAADASSGSQMVKQLNGHDPMDKKGIQWKLIIHQIGLDVVRTDRTLMFYEKQENLSKLWDILAVYAWFDSDVGYCQGMSDLCSPMIILLEDEADAFWCFERLMRRLRGNFRCTGSSVGVGVEAQLGNLASITQVVDPKLHQHLETLGGGDYLFAFRMLMVLFRREFSFGDSLYLWEQEDRLDCEVGSLAAKLDGITALLSDLARVKGKSNDDGSDCPLRLVHHLHAAGSSVPGPNSWGEAATLFVSDVMEAANRISMPDFDGSNLEGRITPAEQYFRLRNTRRMMWALEYDPDLFSMYEDHQSVFKKPEGSEGKAKSRRQCGKFERENLRNRRKYGSAPPPLSVFLVASVLKDKSSKLTEARGLDEVVKILNDITGNLDAKRACVGAMKLHKKYLEKLAKLIPIFNIDCVSCSMSYGIEIAFQPKMLEIWPVVVLSFGFLSRNNYLGA